MNRTELGNGLNMAWLGFFIVPFFGCVVKKVNVASAVKTAKSSKVFLLCKHHEMFTVVHLTMRNAGSQSKILCSSCSGNERYALVVALTKCNQSVKV